MDFVSARLNMVESQVRTNDVTDVDLADAMRAIPRENFCPPDKGHLAYAEAEVEYAPGRRLLQPRDVAKLVFSARPQAGERALCIAAPYAAAMLARIGLTVTALETEDLDERIRAALSAEGVALHTGDLRAPPTGFFDVVIAEGAVAQTPDAWIARLAPGGRLGAVERHGPLGKAQLYTRSVNGSIARRTTFDSTPPFIKGFEPQAGFVF